MRLRLFLTNILLLCALVVLGYDRATYYSDANGKSGAQLKTALYGIMGTPTVKSYSSLWTHYYDTDRLSNNQVVDRYSNTKRYFSGQNGNAVSGMNKEHGIPQSWWGGGTTGIGSDLQHVMPSDTEANSRKSNFGMGIVTNQTWTNGSIKVGKGTAGNNGTVSLWEPADEWKGDFARTYFYMATCYQHMQDLWTTTEGWLTVDGSLWPTMRPWVYQLMLQWADQDPVDDIERQRNEVIFGIQGNRNPFVDYPSLCEYVWGDSTEYRFYIDSKSTRTELFVPINGAGYDFGLQALSKGYHTTIALRGRNLRGNLTLGVTILSSYLARPPSVPSRWRKVSTCPSLCRLRLPVPTRPHSP